MLSVDTAQLFSRKIHMHQQTVLLQQYIYEVPLKGSLPQCKTVNNILKEANFCTTKGKVGESQALDASPEGTNEVITVLCVRPLPVSTVIWRPI